MKAKVVQSEVKTTTLRHKKALEERECELLWKVSTWFYHYVENLHHITISISNRGFIHSGYTGAWTETFSIHTTIMGRITHITVMNNITTYSLDFDSREPFNTLIPGIIINPNHCYY